MIRLLVGLAVAACVPQSQEGKKSEHPPYQVTVMAKTKFARGKDSYQQFQDRLKKMQPGAKFIGTGQIPDDKAGWELWKFEIAWDAKFDQSKINKLFGDMKIGRIDLSVSGEAAVDMKSKIVTLTAFGEKIKVKLLNRPKKDFNDSPENRLAELVKVINEGKTFFQIEGEVVSSGEVWAMYLDGYTAISGPKK